MRYFDAHTHTNFVAFAEDREVVMQRAHDAGVGMNIVGTQYDTSVSAVHLAEQYPDTYATVGLHPIHTGQSYHDEQELGEGSKAFTSRGEIFDPHAYELLAASPKVIAIGECGLDYYRCDESSKQRQKEVFRDHIELANRLNKPLMLHIRNAYEDALEMLKAHAHTGGNVHFFAGSWAIARQFLDLGFTLSFTGVITFARDYDEVLIQSPLDRILAETDSPYVTPNPYRGKRNEPRFVTHVYDAIADVRKDDREKVREVVTKNALKLFKIQGHSCGNFISVLKSSHMKKEKTEQEIIETAEVVQTAEEADSRIYELGYHIVPTVKDEDVEKVVADIRALVEKHKGSFIAEGAPQSIKLAYEMAIMSSHGKRTMYDRAHFGWIKFEVIPEAVVELKKVLAADKRILRSIVFLTVREDTRAAARPLLREVRRTDTIDTTRKVVEEKVDVPVSEEAIDKAIADIVIE